VAVAALLIGNLISGRLPAQAPTGPEMKPLLAVSLSGYDEILGDVTFLGELAGKSGVDQFVEQMLGLFTQGRGLEGLDRSRPWGVVVRTDGIQFQPLVFIPTTDLGKLLDVAGMFGAQASAAGDGLQSIELESPAGPQKFYIKENAGWAFLGQSEASLSNTPEDPLSLLDGLRGEYDVAVRLHVQNIPELFRQMALQQMEAGVQQGLNQIEAQDQDADVDAELQRRLAESQLQSMKRLIEETDHVTIGWLVDRKEKNTHLDINVVALQGTTLARQAAELRETKSAFTGFLQPDAAATMNFSSRYPKEEAAQLSAMLDAVQRRASQAIDEDQDLTGDAAREALKSALKNMIDVLKATAETGLMDGGMLLKLDPASLTFAAGFYLTDVERLETAIKQIAELAEKDPAFPGVTWDAETHQGVRFHTARVPVPADEEQARQLVGEHLDVAIGIGKSSFYLALGSESLATLRSVIDQSQSSADETVVPMSLKVSLSRVLKFAESQNGEPMLAEISRILEGSDGRDHLLVTARPIPHGVGYRFEVEDGVLRALGGAASAAGAVGAGAGADGDEFGAEADDGGF
jgi:hypothetical protein